MFSPLLGVNRSRQGKLINVGYFSRWRGISSQDLIVLGDLTHEIDSIGYMGEFQTIFQYIPNLNNIQTMVDRSRQKSFLPT